MTFRRWPHGIATLIALSLGVAILVTVETGSSTRPTAAASSTSLPGLPRSSPALGAGIVPPPNGQDAAPSRTSPPGADRPPSDTDQAATGSEGSVAAGPESPETHGLSINPYNFRLGLINGTVVQPDARDWAARTVSSGPLLLFLPATRHVPNDYRRFLTVAAQSGYHVLGLDFWNRGKSVATTCGVDARCYTQVQRNRFNGHYPSRFSKVDEANSVLSRLRAGLDYLVKHDPDGGWNQYTSKNDILWRNIVVAGHSQGGGESAYIAHRNRVLGQLTFASPIITDEDISASWLKTPGKTPNTLMYAFDSRYDGFYPRILNSWRELHLPGATLQSVIPVPTTSPTPTHRLVSTLPLGNPGQAHRRTISDSTPLDANGHPVFAPVWKWMLAQVYRQTTPGTTTTDKG